ncbi:MAG: pyrroline-5-carboxylate reductase [Clostridia bacterium]|nr:pyrroline-5-carboxylate reductase [Clostridia bacterium]
MYKFGFIGAGNMGGALARAVAKKSDSVIVCDRSADKAAALANEIGAKAGNIKEVATQSEYIFLAVKPQMLADMFAEIKDDLKARGDRFIFVSMCAGTSIAKITELAEIEAPVIRIMPNVACAVGAGMTLCARNSKVTDDEYNVFASAMSESGKLDMIEEEKIDNYSIVTGCGPAYTYVMIEALADGQVAIGVPRDKAYLYAAQMVEGAAKLMLESGRIPADLKDSVCSPGGTTIEGVKALEKGSVRADIIDAVNASYKRTLELGKK